MKVWQRFHPRHSKHFPSRFPASSSWPYNILTWPGNIFCILGPGINFNLEVEMPSKLNEFNRVAYNKSLFNGLV